MRTLLLGVAAAALFSAPVLAQTQTCQQHIQKFDQAVAGTSAEAAKVTEAKKLRTAGEQKMKSGDEAGCVADLTKANELIGAAPTNE